MPKTQRHAVAEKHAMLRVQEDALADRAHLTQLEGRLLALEAQVAELQEQQPGPPTPAVAAALDPP